MSKSLKTLGAASVLAIAVACSGGDANEGAGSAAGASGGTAGANGSAGAGSGAGFGAAGLGAGEVCGTGTASAALQPVDMLVMFDRSRSMLENDKWPQAASALTAFFEDPEAAGLSVALRFFPHDSPAAGCTENGCDPVACSQVLVDIAPLLAETAPSDAHEAALVAAVVAADPGAGGDRRGGGTPMHAALDGALRWATAHQAAEPDEDTILVFVTDGEPNGCNEDFDDIAGLAATALAGSGVRTYAIGLEGSAQAQMDQLAAAGGTTSGIFIGTSDNAEQELLDALAKIRGETLSCDFAMPKPVDPTKPIDPATINVTFTPGTGSAVTFAQVAAESGCGTTKSWYYDDPTSPTRIHLCPSTCNTVLADPDAKLEILLGCATVCGLDSDCGNVPPPPGVPPIAGPE
jgi:hypothetical protein